MSSCYLATCVRADPGAPPDTVPCKLCFPDTPWGTAQLQRLQRESPEQVQIGFRFLSVDLGTR